MRTWRNGIRGSFKNYSQMGYGFKSCGAHNMAGGSVRHRMTLITSKKLIRFQHPLPTILCEEAVNGKEIKTYQTSREDCVPNIRDRGLLCLLGSGFICFYFTMVTTQLWPKGYRQRTFNPYYVGSSPAGCTMRC